MPFRLGVQEGTAAGCSAVEGEAGSIIPKDALEWATWIIHLGAPSPFSRPPLLRDLVLRE